MKQDIKRHKKSTNKWTPLAPLPIPDRPNLQIHADLFSPMITADSNKKFVLCITDAFSKYAVVTAIASKDAETVADAIYRDWFLKFGILACANKNRNTAQLALLMLGEEGGEISIDIEGEIDPLCDGPRASCDSKEDYFKLNPPKHNFTHGQWQ